MKPLALIVLIALLFVPSLGMYGEPAIGGGYASVVRIDSPLNPLTARFVESQISDAQQNGAELVVLDATVGTGYAPSVDSVAAAVRSSRLPVFIYPEVSTAGPNSAVAYLESVAAGSAGTGARTPNTTRDYLDSLDGNTVTLHGTPIVLQTAGVPIHVAEMNGVAKVLAGLLRPNLAYVLLILGIIGIAVEFSIPGVGVPGIVGGLALLISLVALGALSVNIGGLLIVLLAIGLFVVDIKAPTHGVLTAGGIVTLLVGSFLLFPGSHVAPGLTPRVVSPALIGIMSALLSAVLIVAVTAGARASRRRIVVGKETLIGLTGVAVTALDPDGIVRAGNEEWSARSIGDPVRAGVDVDIVDVQGVRLIVMSRI